MVIIVASKRGVVLYTVIVDTTAGLIYILVLLVFVCIFQENFYYIGNLGTLS